MIKVLATTKNLPEEVTAQRQITLEERINTKKIKKDLGEMSPQEETSHLVERKLLGEKSHQEEMIHPEEMKHLEEMSPQKEMSHLEETKAKEETMIASLTPNTKREIEKTTEEILIVTVRVIDLDPEIETVKDLAERSLKIKRLSTLSLESSLET